MVPMLAARGISCLTERVVSHSHSTVDALENHFHGDILKCSYICILRQNLLVSILQSKNKLRDLMSRQGLDIQLRHNLHKSSIIFINSFILVLSAFLVRHAIICKNIERDVKCSHPSYKMLIILECTVLLNLVMILAKRGIFEVFFDDNKFFFIVKRLPMGFLVFANLRINLTEPRKDLGF